MHFLPKRIISHDLPLDFNLLNLPLDFPLPKDSMNSSIIVPNTKLFPIYLVPFNQKTYIIMMIMGK